MDVLRGEIGVTTTIRLVRPADVAALLDLMQQLYVEDGTVPFRRDAHRAATERLLDAGDAGQIYVVECSYAIVGYAVLTWGYSLEYGGTQALLDEMYIAPSHRRKGLARQLLKIVESACRDLGARALHLEVERSNVAVQRLYQSHGFSSQDRLLLTKRLDG
jgi:diamine N-acetyltransferase